MSNPSDSDALFCVFFFLLLYSFLSWALMEVTMRQMVTCWLRLTSWPMTVLPGSVSAHLLFLLVLIKRLKMIWNNKRFDFDSPEWWSFSLQGEICHDVWWACAAAAGLVVCGLGQSVGSQQWLWLPWTGHHHYRRWVHIKCKIKFNQLTFHVCFGITCFVFLVWSFSSKAPRSQTMAQM